MAYRLPEKVRSLTPYAPVSGECRIRCDANESGIGLPPALSRRVAARLAAVEFNRYPDPYAAECCALAALRYGVKPEQVVAGNGSDELIGLLENALLSRGAKVAAFDLDFSMYPFYAALAELELVALPKRADLTIDVDAVLGALDRSGADMLIFSNPCNPTSLLLPRAEVRRLVKHTRALVVVDEAYMEFADASAAGLIEDAGNLMVLRTCSKAAGLAGARLGFALGQKPLIDALKCAKSPYNVNALTQALAAEVLAAPGYVDDCARLLAGWTRGLQQGLERLAAAYPGRIGAVYPASANFVLVRTAYAREIWDGLRENGISVRLLDGYLRVSAGQPGENSEILATLEKLLGAGGCAQ